MYLLIIIGLVLFILPGIYLAVAFSMALPLVIDKGMTPWQALMTSRKAMTHKWFSLFGFFLICVLVTIAGVLALFVGLVWAVPLTSLGYAIIYRDVFGVEAKTLEDN